jgi:hypothetical protein
MHAPACFSCRYRHTITTGMLNRHTIRQYPYAQYRHIFIHIDWNFSRCYAFLKHEYKIQLPGLNWNIWYIFCSGFPSQRGLDLVGLVYRALGVIEALFGLIGFWSVKKQKLKPLRLSALLSKIMFLQRKEPMFRSFFNPSTLAAHQIPRCRSMIGLNPISRLNFVDRQSFNHKATFPQLDYMSSTPK